MWCRVIGSLMLLACPMLAQQRIGSGVVIGGGVSVGGGLATSTPPPPTGISFSPAAGTYVGAQSVTVTCPTGKTCFYTTDGSTPSIAGTPVSSAISVAATKTLKVIAAKVKDVIQSTNATSSGWKCVTPVAATFGSLHCESGGGVGANNPSNVVWSWGSPMLETLSTIHATSETQALFVHTSSGTCTDCTMLVQDKIVQVDKGPTFIANNEMDANINMKATYNQFHTASLQCNQQSGNPKGSGSVSGPQWQYDNQQGSWKNFNPSVTYGCPLSTTQQTEIRYGIHWANGDTACSGFSCDHYDFLTVCVGGTLGTGGTCQDFNFTAVLPGYTEPSWSQSIVIQDQPDLTNTAACGTSPCTAVRKVWNNNVTSAYFGTTETASAAYTIH